MVKGLIITDRDQRLLYDCYQNVALSCSQIGKRHFPNAKVPTICNRIGKLNRAGLLRKQRVGILLYQGEPNEVGVVYQITRKGIQYLRVKYPGDSFRDNPVQLNTSTLAHDLLLTDALLALKGKAPDQKIVQGRVLSLPRQSSKRVPDAVILDDRGKPNAAIELELTAKSDRRYVEIVTQYRLMPEYPKVLYIVGASAIADKIRSHILGYKPTQSLPGMSTSKFYFVRLDELLTRPNQALLSNGATELFSKMAA